MAKYIIGAIVIIVLLAGGYYLSHRGARITQPETTPTPTSQQVATTSYNGDGFTLVYPVNFTVDPTFENDTVVPTKPIKGVKFQISGTMATGTNLSSDTYLSIETLPRAKKCTADIYLPGNVKAQSWSDNGVNYSVASTTGAAAGNRYEETVYALSSSKPCLAVRYFIHYSAIENYPQGTVQQFDENALMNGFDTIRRSLVLTSSTSNTTP